MAKKKGRKKQGKKRKSVRMHNAIVQIRVGGRSKKKKAGFFGPKLPKGFKRRKGPANPIGELFANMGLARRDAALAASKPSNPIGDLFATMKAPAKGLLKKVRVKKASYAGYKGFGAR